MIGQLSIFTVLLYILNPYYSSKVWHESLFLMKCINDNNLDPKNSTCGCNFLLQQNIMCV
jgi:hypothetical protein